MPRKPVNLERAGGKSQRQRIWEAMRIALRNFSAITIAADCKDIHTATVSSYFKALRKAGYIEPVTQRGRARYLRYDLIRDTGIDAPRLDESGREVTQGREQQQLWQTMRILPGDFDHVELAALASTDDVPVTLSTARHYLAHLNRAGYLTQTQPAARVNGRAAAARWRLTPTKNSGPRAPIVQRTLCIYDQNLAKIVWQQEPEE